MRYDRNYRDQFFWDSDVMPSIADALFMAKNEMMYQRVKAPKNWRSSLIRNGMLIALIVIVISLAVLYIVTKSYLLVIVMGILSVIFAMGVLVLVLSFMTWSISRKKVTHAISARCIGLSINGMTQNGSLVKTPVFEYEYGGTKYTAFDGKWTNVKREIPEIGSSCDILIDPDEPEDMEWDTGNSVKRFLVLFGLGAIAMSILFGWITLQDEAFMSEALSQGQTTTAISEKAP